MPKRAASASTLAEPALPSYEALLAGASSGGQAFDGKDAMEGLARTFEGEQKGDKLRRKKMMEWDRMLKDFRYGDALDSVLRKVSFSFAE